MKLTIAIPTYNRFEVLAIVAGVLQRHSWLAQVNLRIYDDHSSLAMHQLEQLFPSSAEIVKRQERLGPDANIHQMLLDFLETDDDYIAFIDSDLVVSEKAFDVIRTTMPETEGVLSLYNSLRHHIRHETTKANRTLLLKHRIGNAGTVMNRERAAEIVSQVERGRWFDTRYSKYLTKRGVPLYVTEKSYVQHIGFRGFNCNAKILDLGASFDSDDPETLAVTYKALEAELPAIMARLSRRPIRRAIQRWYFNGREKRSAKTVTNGLAVSSLAQESH